MSNHDKIMKSYSYTTEKKDAMVALENDELHEAAACIARMRDMLRGKLGVYQTREELYERDGF